MMQDTLKLLPEYLVTTKPILESEDLLIVLQKLLIAIFIGVLIGLEREHSKPKEENIFAGIRTFPLISMLGFLAAMISVFTSFWVYLIIFFGYSLLIAVSHFFSAKEGRKGGTSEISTLLVFILGSLVFWNYTILAAIVGVVIVLFLSLKIQLHSFVGKISEEDIYATVKLAIITVIVLPLLPDETFGPFDVLNPRLIWYMVIFISGISFIGYVLIRFYGMDKGIPITGLMGGLVSSTAVAVSFSRKSKENTELSENLAVGIILASTVMYPRVLIVLAVVNPSLISSLWVPVLIFSALGLIISYFLSKKIKKAKYENVEIKNPFELKSALLFGLIFGAVVFISKAAQEYFGEGGIYAASGLAGITSVDAIVISLAKLSAGGLLEKTATAAVLIALISNTIIKGIIAFVLGAKELKNYIIVGLGSLTIVSVIYLILLLIL